MVTLPVEASTGAPVSEYVFPVNAVKYRISVNITSKAMSPGQRWCDTGCARGLGGMIQHHALDNIHRQYNLCPVTERCNATFKFGNGQMEEATVSKQYNVFAKGLYRGAINHAVAKSNIPMR